MLSTKVYTLKDYEYTRHSSIFYKKEGCKIRKEYVIEYCDDMCKLNRLGLLPEYGGLELDDVYHSITFKENENERFCTLDGIAMERYLAYLFSDKIVDLKMWENIYDGDELIEERFFEFPATFCHEMARRITKDITETHDRLEKERDALLEENVKMRAFLEKYHAYDKYKEENT
jgi:hypothetical protein